MKSFLFGSIGIAFFLVTLHAAPANARYCPIAGQCIDDWSDVVSFATFVIGKIPTVKLKARQAKGVTLLLWQNLLGNHDGPKIEFKNTVQDPDTKGIYFYKSWTAGIINGRHRGDFVISELGDAKNGFGAPRVIISPEGNVAVNTDSIPPLTALNINGDVAIKSNDGSGIKMWLAVGDDVQCGRDNEDAMKRYVGFNCTLEWKRKRTNSNEYMECEIGDGWAATSAKCLMQSGTKDRKPVWYTCEYPEWTHALCIGDR